jgi:hypothetical protein
MLALFKSNPRESPNHMIPSRKRPWYVFYPLAGMLLLSALWCGYWFIEFTGAKELVLVKRQEFLNRGLQLNCANESRGGFPFRFEFQCEAASLQFTTANETINFQSMKILAVAQAYNPLHVLILIDGPSSVNGVELTHDRALVSVTVNGSGNLDVSSEAARVNAQGLFSADQLNFYGREINGKLDLAADAEGLTILAPGNPPISITKAAIIAQTSATLLNQPSPLDHAAATGEPLEISSLKISQGPVDFSAQGKIFLDPQRRLAGKLSSQTNDIDGLMKFIAPIFALNEDDSAAIKNLVSMAGTDPTTNTTKADFTARDGALYWGLLKLTDLEPLY